MRFKVYDKEGLVQQVVCRSARVAAETAIANADRQISKYDVIVTGNGTCWRYSRPDKDDKESG